MNAGDLARAGAPLGDDPAASVDEVLSECAELLRDDPGLAGHVLSRVRDSLGAIGAPELELLAGGMVNKQIARALGISESTVKVHLGHIYQRLGVDNRSRAAMWARSYGYGTGPTSTSRRQ